MCGALRASDAGKQAVLMGWVNKRRDHGSLLFIDLRDRTGITQVVFNADRNAAIHEKAGLLRNEFVIAVIGTVKLRDANTVNPNMPTGEVELVADGPLGDVEIVAAHVTGRIGQAEREPVAKPPQPVRECVDRCGGDGRT